MTEQTPSTSKRQINVGRRLACEVSSALVSAFAVTPIVKIVDISVTTGQSGKAPVFTTAFNFLKSLVTTPHKFFTSKYFGWIYFVYGATYTANNTLDSLCKIYHLNEVAMKLIFVTAVNMTTSIMKDAAFAKYFGTKPPSKIPFITYCIWFVRDMLSIAAAFVLPERVSAYMQRKNNVSKGKADVSAQFSVPIGMQVVLLPIHLLGLDIYNNNVSTAGDRAKRIFKNYLPSLPLRFIRMASAYGVGGVTNKNLRNKFISHYEGNDWNKRY